MLISSHVRPSIGGHGPTTKAKTKKKLSPDAHARPLGVARFGAVVICTLVLTLIATTTQARAFAGPTTSDAAISATVDTSPAIVAIVAPPDNAPITIAASAIIPTTTPNSAPAIQEHTPVAQMTTTRNHAIAAVVHSIPIHRNA